MNQSNTILAKPEKKSNPCAKCSGEFECRACPVRPSSCPHCGAPNPVLKQGYVGGSGHEFYWGCADEEACWDRWDKQHGLVKL